MITNALHLAIIEGVAISPALMAIGGPLLPKIIGEKLQRRHR